MPKALTIMGMAVAGLLLLIFVLNLALGVPFGSETMVVDILFLLSAVILGYMSWSTFREVR